jgi:anti-sigma regulatory factor (Ser/Thr protein kinase)
VTSAALARTLRKVQTRADTSIDEVFGVDPAPSSVPGVRRRAGEYAGSLMSAGQVAKLDLAITEVVSNAVKHSGCSDQILVALTPKDGYLCVRVTDGGAGLVPSPGAMATEPGAGYGLFLVENLTRRWGMTREDGRTRVWFELDYREEAEAGT